MKVAVEGCVHGELDKIYESIVFLQDVFKKNNLGRQKGTPFPHNPRSCRAFSTSGE